MPSERQGPTTHAPEPFPGTTSRSDTIRKISFVGALRFEPDGKDADSLRLMRALDYLRQSGVRVAADFEVDIVNLLHGRDFLAETTAADLVYISFVPNVDHRLFHKLSDEELSEQRRALASGEPGRPSSFFWQSRSPLHGDSRWQQRIRTTGAPLVLCYGGKKEIGTSALESPPYRTVVPSPDYLFCSPYRGWSTPQLYSGIDWDIPYRWLGILAHDAYSPDVEGGASADTMLAGALASRRAPTTPLEE
jgi:hypothetical protein